MTHTHYTPTGIVPTDHIHTTETQSAVAWGAIIAGAVAATALVIVLLSIGAGLGLSAVSPWHNDGASAATLALSTVIGLILVQWLSAAFGGYITGRLRTKWEGIHGDEVYFRDSAHGFLAWALGAVLGGVLLTATATSIIGGAGKAVTEVTAASAAAGTAAGVNQHDSLQGWLNQNGYSLDRLLRSNKNAAQSDAEIRAETGRILVKAVTDETVTQADRDYLAKRVAQHSDLTLAEAQTRVDNTIAEMKAAELKARELADQARKSAARLAMYTALSMLIGAFIAMVAGIIGGRHRDEY